MPKQETIRITFSLNGKLVETQVQPVLTLLEMLRRNFSLTATKEGCGKGECGACTLLFNGFPLNSCLKLAATLRPTDSVVTLEGLENDPLMGRLQKAYVDEGAVQCGLHSRNGYLLVSPSQTPSESVICPDKGSPVGKSLPLHRLFQDRASRCTCSPRKIARR